MKNQLSNISVQYRKFSKGQYIEDPDQFNEFLNFFEDQDRLSRVLLQGVGIACGLKPKLIYKNRLLSSIELSQGAALTTDGDLLTLNKTNKVSEDLYVSDLKTVNLEYKSFTHFKAYDNFKIRYPSFYEGEEQIELWELATAQEAQTDFQPVANLSNLNDKYLLLYLEDYEKDVKPCRGVDCDNHGVLQIRNLKVLVTTAQGIVHILGDDRLVTDPITGITKPGRKDRIQPHPLFTEDILGPVEPQRVILSRFISESGVENRYTAADLKKLYSDALAKDGFGQAVFEKIQTISQIMGFSVVYPYQIFKEKVEKCLALDAGFQYAYDVTKDLMATYSEIIKLLPKAFTKNFPNFASFPKHIMLGKLISDTQLDSTRHQFYNSPVLDDEKATQRLKELVNRFNQQVFNFNYLGNKKTIKITSSQKLNPLSNKAIPFYYDVTEGFLKSWNFDNTSNRSFADNVRYDLTFLIPGSGSQDPVDFSIDKSSFYNIEGHQGMDFQKAFEQIKQIRDKEQLGFDIVALSLEELVGNKDLSIAYFNDYVDKHPGLEHRHGVEKGGSFLIVYDSIRNPKVIADFSLPYICCTPKTEVKLSLPSNVICSKAGAVPFTVLPVSGVVKASVTDNLNGGVELINGQYFFNPGMISPSLIGQEISFTVNGKPTSCSIKVVTQPDVTIDVVSVDYPGDGSNATTINFKISGTSFTDYIYKWDFWDDGGLITLNPDADGMVSYTLYDLNPKNIPVIKVNVSGNGCTQDIFIRDWYKVPARLSLPTDIICSGDDAIRFTEVIPAGGPIVAYVGANIIDNHDQVIRFNNGTFYFSPNGVNPNLYGQYITFKVDGQPTNCRIKVVPPPKVSTNYSVDYPANGSTLTTIHIEVSGPYFADYLYEWDFLGDGHYSFPDHIINGKISYTYHNLDLNNIPVIGVRVSGGGCSQRMPISDWYTSLRLPQSVICSDAKPISFTEIIPKNGTIQAYVGNVLVAGVVSGSFDPNLVDPSFHGQVITFTVKGKQTNCSIKVIKQPNVAISVRSVDYPTGGSNETKVNLYVSGTDLANYDYSVDGNPISKPDANGFTSCILRNVNPEGNPTINVTVSNGACNQIVSITNWYKPPYVTINNIDFSEGVQCCEVAMPVVEAKADSDKFRQSDLSFTLKGIATLNGIIDDADHPKLIYSWHQISGPSGAVLIGADTRSLTVTNLLVDTYIFRFMAFDPDSGAFDAVEGNAWVQE
ncbi:PKD domain-containing protein [Chryseobacterium arthrosphaerae]|uniref:PKD domain-containing protein n=1 Tax=Chryseobacterium arthrosphaerae TaxID=651561 RepID=UPI003D3376C7